MAVTAPAHRPIGVHGLAGRRVAAAALLAVIVIALALAVPALRPVGREIREMNASWVAAAVALELASCLSFVVLFRAFFERVGARDARALAWTTMASGVLLPGGGVGGLAIGGWLMRLAGSPTAWIVRRSSALFFFTSAINAVAVMAAGLLLVTGAAGPHDFDRAALPLLVAATLTLVIAGAPWLAHRRGLTLARLDGVVEGILDAQRAARHPSWRLGGAIGYLAFDIAVLWATFSAIGRPPPVAALVLGYTIGYAANALPIPGGAGVLDAGLVGALVLYGAAPIPAAAAVLVYHAIALWVPLLGGLIAYTRLRPRLMRAQAVEAS
jgi:uncharacterized membrane protein YbhN (UPF0104 family)